MARTKPTRKTCKIPRCPQPVKNGFHCAEHAHPAALQRVIDDTTLRKAGGLGGLLQHEPVKRLLSGLAELKFRAEPGKGSSLGETRGGFSDGTVAIGDDIVTLGYAANVRADQGRLGAALAKVSQTADDVESILDPLTPRRKDMRVACGQCPDPRERHRKQPADSRHCKYCGAQFGETAEKEKVR